MTNGTLQIGDAAHAGSQLAGDVIVNNAADRERADRAAGCHDAEIIGHIAEDGAVAREHRAGVVSMESKPG